MQDQALTNNQYDNVDVLKQFDLEKLSISEKSTSEFGKKISQKIWSYVQYGLGGYYYNRNARYVKNRNYANGRIDVQTMFQDRFDFNGKQNYIRLVWQTLQIVNRIVSGLVGRWMQRGEKVVVNAIDDLSQTNKQIEYDDLEVYLLTKAKLEKLQQASGVPMMPQMENLPADKEELNLWKAQFQRLPEEIEIELGCNEVLASNGWFDVLKELSLHDSAETGFVGTETYMDGQGVIHVDWVKPENAIYSASDYQDFRDTSWRGVVPDMKISELRRDYGKEFHPENSNALDEQQLFKIAQTAKEYKSVTNLTWDLYGTGWSIPYSLRPYDEWNVRAMKFEIKTVDVEPYTVTKTSFNTTYTRRGLPLDSTKKVTTLKENQKVVNDTNWNIYRGVYLPDNDILLEWGLKKNMIRAQDPKEIGNAEFSYSFYMYQNYQMRNLAIPEKIEAAVDGMIFALLKMQQVMARLVPNGWAIDETKLNDIDYGVADATEPIDHAKSFFQTGLMYYKGVDGEGNRTPEPPIHELANSGFVNQMAGLIQNYQFNYQTLKDELGEDPNLITAALQPRVTASNVDASQATSENATDYIYRAYAECMKITSRKVTCLLKDSVAAGAQAYRSIVKQDGIGNRVFSTDIKFLSTAQEAARFEAILNQTVASIPELLQFLDPFRLMRIAKEDVKLAELLFRQAQKKLVIYQQQTTAQNAQLNAQAQQQSLQMKAAFDKDQMQTELRMKGDLSDRESRNKLLEVFLTGALAVEQKGVDLKPEWQPLQQEIIANILMPLFSQNMQNIGTLGEAIKQQQLLLQEQQAQQQAAQQQQNQSQPPSQAAA